MTAALVILAIALAGAVATSASLAWAAISRADKSGDLRERAAKADGNVQVANLQVAACNRAVAEIDAARKRQEVRADALEKELEDAEANPIGLADAGAMAGRARLRASLRAAAAHPAAAGSGGDDRHEPVPVWATEPDAPAGGVAASGGDAAKP